MVLYENYAAVSNQAGVQNISGDVIFNYVGASHKRLQRTQPNELPDDEIVASLAFPRMLDRRSNIESAHPQTCQWLFHLDQYRVWEKAPCSLLWIKGKPGSGKSTLMSHLHHTLCLEGQSQADVRIEFFFNARGSALQSTFIGMLRSLLIQIFQQAPDPSVRQHLRAAYNAKTSAFGIASNINDWEWQLPELKRLFTDTILALTQKYQAVVLIDALDEAGGESAREITTYIHSVYDRIVDSAGRGRLCISCRHYPIISNFEAIQVIVEKYNQDDIAHYIRDHLRVRRVAINEGSQDLQNIISTLVDMANGVFQWVRLVTPMVVNLMNEGNTIDHIRTSLSQVPKDLEAVYEYILKDVVDPRYIKKTLRLFQWVCLAQRPLSIVEMRYALSAENIEIGRFCPSVRFHETLDFEESYSDMSRLVMIWSGGLLEAVSDGQRSRKVGEKMIVQVIHQSVSEFLLARGLPLLLALEKSGHSQNMVSSPISNPTEAAQRTHASLYLSCLKYLYFERPSQLILPTGLTTPQDLEQQIENAPGESPLSPRRTLQKRLRTKFPFFDYSISCGLTHAEKCGSYRNLHLEDEARLLATIFSAWNLTDNAWELHGDQSFVQDGTTVLHFASRANLVDLAQYRIQNGDNPSAKDAASHTPLLEAAKRGHLTMAMMLQKAGADVNIQSHLGQTPLLAAISGGYVEMTVFLLSHGADMKCGSLTALCAAAEQGNSTICRICIDEGADVNETGGVYGNALLAAVCEGHREVVQVLLEAGAKLDSQREHDVNMFLRAVLADFQEVVQLLLRAGVDVNAETDGGNALQKAIHRGHQGMARLLIDAGADVNTRGGRHENILQLTIRKDCKNLVKTLLDAGADVNAEGGTEGNALHLAVSRGHKELVPLLLEAGADVNARGGPYSNALQAAIRCGHKELVPLLLEAGADVNMQGGPYGNTLQTAVLCGYKETVQHLLEEGADVNAQGGFFGNALQAAVHTGDKELVRILLESGADVDARGGQFSSALEAAETTHKPEIADMLRIAGAQQTLPS